MNELAFGIYSRNLDIVIRLPPLFGCPRLLIFQDFSHPNPTIWTPRLLGTVEYVSLHKHDFIILNLSYITCRLIIHVETV